MTIEITKINNSTLDEWFELRLESIKFYPKFFLSTYELEVLKGVEHYRGVKNLFGAYKQGKLIGIVSLAQSDNPKLSHKANIWGLYVKSEHSGAGIGKKLVLHTLKFAKEELKVDMLNLAVASINPGAIRLYESLNFKRWGVEPDAVREGVESVDDYYYYLRI